MRIIINGYLLISLFFSPFAMASNDMREAENTVKSMRTLADYIIKNLSVLKKEKDYQDIGNHQLKFMSQVTINDDIKSLMGKNDVIPSLDRLNQACERFANGLKERGESWFMRHKFNTFEGFLKNFPEYQIDLIKGFDKKGINIDGFVQDIKRYKEYFGNMAEKITKMIEADRSEKKEKAIQQLKEAKEKKASTVEIEKLIQKIKDMKMGTYRFVG